MRQKKDQKRLEKDQEAKERTLYNERVGEGIEAEKLKDLSYKNVNSC